jgi:hypothetical protein
MMSERPDMTVAMMTMIATTTRPRRHIDEAANRIPDQFAQPGKENAQRRLQRQRANSKKKTRGYTNEAQASTQNRPTMPTRT